MPNWAFGYVNVTGTRDGIKSFIERFVSEDDPSTIPGKRFFARSFIQSKRQAFIDEATPVRSTMCWMRHAYLGIFFYPLMRRLASAMSFSIWAAMMKWFPKRKSAKRSQMNVWNPVSMLREAVYT